MSNIPNHVAVIPDGNRRWAKERNLPTFEGHRRGFNQILKIGKKARELGVKVLTLWGFSTENWNRTEKEVNNLMRLYGLMTDAYLKEALKEEIRMVHIGRKDRLSKRLLDKIIEAEDKTKNFNKYYLVSAIDYGGRDEIIRVIQQICNSQFPISKLNEENINQFLDTKDLPYPNPDLIIRTSGEERISGFMLWQAAYAEYVFSDKNFPDFTPEDFESCIKEYQKRQRRFGK